MTKEEFENIVKEELERIVNIADNPYKKEFYKGWIAGIFRLYRSYFLEIDSLEYLDTKKEFIDRIEVEYESKLDFKLDIIKKMKGRLERCKGEKKW